MVSDDTKRALLRGLRLPADTAADAAGSLARLSDDAARALPAALVVRGRRGGSGFGSAPTRTPAATC